MRRRSCRRRPIRTLLYEKQGHLEEFPVFTETDVEGFAAIYFEANSTQDQIYATLAPVVERFKELHEDERHNFRGELSDYVRLYSFLAQVLPFSDVALEKLYAFARHLRRLLPHTREELPREIQQNIDMESYRIQQTGSGKVSLDPKGKTGALDPVATKRIAGKHARRVGSTFAHHCRPKRAIRYRIGARTPSHARPNDGAARRGRRA